MIIRSMDYNICTNCEMSGTLEVVFNSPGEFMKLNRDFNESREREFTIIPKDEVYIALTRTRYNSGRYPYGSRTMGDEKVPSLKEVIFNEPATICIWSDGTKTVVKCEEGDTFDKEKGIALCFMKKINGNKGNFNNIFKKFIKEKEEN